MGAVKERLQRTAYPLQALGARARLAVAFGIAAVVATAFFAGIALSHGTAWVFASEAGLSSNQAEDQSPNACEGVVGIPFGTDPGWVRVGGSTSPSTPFVQARGQILPPHTPPSQNKTNPFVTHTDAPFNHYSKDINIFLSLDAAYRHLLSEGNFEEGDENEHGQMEIEWERGGIPMYAWPSVGDRITLWGPHIWDCGHGDTWLGGDDTYRTEVHAPVGWVLYRQTADEDAVPQGDKRTQDPWKYFESTDLDGIGVKLPSSGLKNTVVQASVADAFFSSFAGNVPESLNGCDTDFVTCTQDNEWRQSLLQQDYVFFVPAPPKPQPDAQMIWESENRCSEVPSNPGNPPGDDVEDVGEADDSAENIGSPTCNIPDEVLVTTGPHGEPGIRVTVKASSSGVGYPSNEYIVFAKRYKVAWDWVPPAAQRARTFKVDLNHIKVYDDSEPCGEDGEWVMSIRVNEAWIHPVRGHGDDGDPFWSSGAIDDDKCGLHDATFKQYSVGESLTVSVVAGRPVNVWSRTYDIDTLANDVLPVINAFHFGPGSFSSGVTNHDVEGAHTLNYAITDLTPAAPTPGTLVIGTPTYGPNADTGGAHTRIAAATTIALQGSDAAELQYRLWKDGQPVPGAWTDDADKSFTLGAASGDGRYSIEYAPVSAGGIVGERRIALVELDATPPVLSVPASFETEATSALGANVTYEASAVDALPGPVTFSCAPASGSFFAIKKVTTVICTASDAVGNSAQKSFTIEVVSPFGYIPDFVVLGRDWVDLARDTRVQSGNVGAFASSAGVPSWPPFEVVAGTTVRLPGGPKIAAESVRLLSDVIAGNVYTVDPVVADPNAVYTQKNGYVPLFPELPAFPSFSAGSGTVRVRTSQALAPGAYGAVTVQPGVVLSLSAGNYFLQSLSLSAGSTLLVAGPGTATVHVLTWASVGSGADAGGEGAATDLVLYVAGTGGPPGQQSPFQTGSDVRLAASVYAPNGTVELGPAAVARGTFLGRRVKVGAGARLALEGGAFDITYP